MSALAGAPTPATTAKARVAPRARVSRARAFVARDGADYDFDRRAALLAGGLLASTLALPEPAALAASTSLAERVERRDLSKPVFNKARPGPTRFPDWLEGTWRCTSTFEGFDFPSKNINKNALLKEPTVPGFQKMSLVYVPDVGTSDVEYLVRFVRANDGDGGVCEDRVFNLKSIVDAYLKRPDAVEAVEYDAASDANRVTVRLAPGVSNNAERIELFSNARESETRASDGTFFAAEALRQVTLGYSKDYNKARVVNTDYQHVWSYTPTYESDGSIRRVRCALSTAGYIQPSDAMRLTAMPNLGGGAPVPSMGNMGNASFEPAVLYSHTIVMERV
ncbi:uncharacterized protein MICPUCDRAFT_56248 [Micromonas pusilla CCMP1545]|jgi:hypothetical protein|uniref:Predicted protein n=1 Tax=Micromonas pusilla (strain CCMP1545) TaxID=564608 RepID=C1MLR9_MICPC|nr:uncharacterized protein MICPUCDRAFT_56248 [Micromonas pusilla CCMP1545]EEH58455.1 predicted protein [Micromonas pusilla CCMP1545]|eukprot:XP_003056810.1 predicted protein [Micromonas pusilla CCMP1545]